MRNAFRLRTLSVAQCGDRCDESCALTLRETARRVRSKCSHRGAEIAVSGHSRKTAATARLSRQFCQASKVFHEQIGVTREIVALHVRLCGGCQRPATHRVANELAERIRQSRA